MVIEMTTEIERRDELMSRGEVMSRVEVMSSVEVMERGGLPLPGLLKAKLSRVLRQPEG